jgi:hypothetical protein
VSDTVERPRNPRPDLVLRIAFAGTRELTGERETTAAAALAAVYTEISDALHAVVARRGNDPRSVARFYSDSQPVVRLVTGLARGADDLAARVLFDAAIPRTPLTAELAAVLPFPAADYLASQLALTESESSLSDDEKTARVRAIQSRFTELSRQCAYIVELDGRYVGKPADRKADEPGAVKRAAAYRAQSAVLLRHADLLIAMPDLDAEGSAGGTKETMHTALDLGLPVVLIDAGNGGTRVLERGDDVDDVLPAAAAAAGVSRRTIAKIVTTIVADPDQRQSAADDAEAQYTIRVLEEFFDRPTTPPLRRTADGKVERWETRRERAWKWFAARFGEARGQADPPIDAYLGWRRRATSLTYHYVGLYRGGFLLNFGLATVAVGLAALSLVILTFPPETEGGEIAQRTALITLGVIKLALLVAILLNTRRSKTELWNDRAVDYRYLAERLRSLFYLPYCCSFQPTRTSPGYHSRRVRQSAVDWLLDAIVRHVSPASALGNAVADGQGTTPSDPAASVPRLRSSPIEAARRIHDGWLTLQLEYHRSNSTRMRRMCLSLERITKWLNTVVVVMVSVDLAVLLGTLFHIVPASWHHAAPWLIFLSALLPAAVAAANGTRVQSECERLAERSKVMADIIKGRLARLEELQTALEAARTSRDDRGSWTPSVLRLAEAIDADMLKEAAEWSVLYAKVIPEP